ADPQTPLGIECQRQRPQQAAIPEGKARSLIFAVHLLDVGPKDAAAEHQIGKEELAGERPELAAAAIVGDAVDRFRPGVGNPKGRLAERLRRMVSLRRIGETVEAAFRQMTELVRRHPFALIIGEENFALGTAAPAQGIAKAEADLARLLSGNETQRATGAG